MLKHGACAFAKLLLFAVLVGACQPAQPGAEGDGNSTPANAEQAESEQPEDKTPAPKEAAYPYQVNAELAKVYLKYNITDEAIRLFDLAIQQQLQQTNSEDADNWIGLADALKNAGRTKEAALAYNKSLQILERILPNTQDNQHHNLIITRLAQVCTVLGLEDKRMEYLEQLKADDDVPAQQLELAQIFQQIGNAEKAEQHYKRALELTSEDPPAHASVQVAYGNMLFALERYEEAMPMAKAAMESEQAEEETRKQARRLVFELYEARGEADKLEFKD